MAASDARPRVMPPASPIDRALNIVAVLILGLMFLGTALAYPQLPDRIPTKFDLQGNPTAWGPRGTVWILPGAAAQVFVILSLVMMIKPWYWNYPVRVTEENAPALYASSRRLLHVLKVEVCAMFAWITYLVVSSAMRGTAPGMWMALAPVVVVLGTVGWWVVRLVSLGGSRRVAL